jgi:hypothetical protein
MAGFSKTFGHELYCSYGCSSLGPHVGEATNGHSLRRCGTLASFSRAFSRVYNFLLHGSLRDEMRKRYTTILLLIRCGHVEVDE